MVNNKPPRHRHREIFFAHNGPGPYKCVECKKRIWFKDVTVHHHDGNHDNNKPRNLVPMHFKCHRALHCRLRTGIKRGPNKKRDYIFTDEHRAKISRAKTGQSVSPEARAKISAAHKRRWERVRNG
jgi:hypothetical protein